MLHPSYIDLLNAVNSSGGDGGEPVVQSRYSIVIASAKRARQLIDKELKEEKEQPSNRRSNKKPLSVAIDELYHQQVKIVPEGKSEDEQKLGES